MLVVIVDNSSSGSEQVVGAGKRCIGKGRFALRKPDRVNWIY